ncbi:LysM-like peptidoglycan-binding domain-containing protein [Sodalis-like endosymbiont of Proechinophthirus fluctus]|uniref:LysM-like peptidoglycan-binding domain-containing protein n=1 Tax=Sodalis-like endosymbiont of Proechinophthirus fluctus TaxID=1462730 RepID=UPI00093FED87|nr:LysM-like peptidoglycan-binding domain-containing protein [Sodalis-like endosymbiont of Proechinophthirus fluctus]
MTLQSNDAAAINAPQRYGILCCAEYDAELIENSVGDSNTDEQGVQTYRVVEGQTLAQLFRAHNLPVADVFPWHRWRANNKPLSNLQVGQEVHIVQNP